MAIFFSEQYNPDDLVTLEAGGDMSAQQFRFVELASDGQLQVTDSTTDDPIGVIQNDPDAAGEPAECLPINSGGMTKGVVDTTGGSISIGSKLGPDAAGRATLVASGSYYALALEAATTQGEIIIATLVGETAV